VGLYSRFVLPRLTHLACSARPNRRQRDKVVPRARGEVLEIGFGSGLNLPHYDPAEVSRIWALEPHPGMRRLAASAVASSPIEIEFLDLPAEEIPLADGSVDTVLMTYTLCSIADPQAALAAMARVLKPGGQLLFCEHGASPDAAVRRWQARLNPLWKRLAGGCNLDREVPRLLVASGFSLDSLETIYLPGWRPGTFNYWGAASVRGAASSPSAASAVGS
jgi:ubiquinone/menaquinone biosynthesis C-methylase UbiE